MGEPIVKISLDDYKKLTEKANKYDEGSCLRCIVKKDLDLLNDMVNKCNESTISFTARILSMLDASIEKDNQTPSDPDQQEIF